MRQDSSARVHQSPRNRRESDFMGRPTIPALTSDGIGPQTPQSSSQIVGSEPKRDFSATANLRLSWLDGAARQLQEIRLEVEKACELDSETEVVPESAYGEARFFLNASHPAIPMPDIMWLEDGGIGFDLPLTSDGIGPQTPQSSSQIVGSEPKRDFSATANLRLSWLDGAARQLQEIRLEVEKACELDSETEVVPESAYDEAYFLLNVLHPVIPMPDIMWLEDGGIGLEWRPGDGIATMSLYGDGLVVYGAFFTDNREVSGICPLSDAAFLQGFLTTLGSLFQCLQKSPASGLPPMDEALFAKHAQQLATICQEAEEAWTLDNEIDPVPASAYDDARLLLQLLLRADIPTPDISWAEDGSLGFEWRPGDSIATMGIYGDNLVIYGAFFDDNRQVEGICALSDTAMLSGFLATLNRLFKE